MERRGENLMYLAKAWVLLSASTIRITIKEARSRLSARNEETIVSTGENRISDCSLLSAEEEEEEEEEDEEEESLDHCRR